MHVGAMFNASTNDALLQDTGIIATLRICEHFSWSIDYVQGLPVWYRRVVIGYLQGLTRIEKHRAEQLKLRTR